MVSSGRREFTEVIEPTEVELGYIDFGCGEGKSAAFAEKVLSAPGLCVDRSEEAIATCVAKGLDARVGDILEFTGRNVAKGAVVMDVMQQIDRPDFEAACIAIIRAVRNFAVIQHHYFDMDGLLAAGGTWVRDNYAKDIVNKPTLGDYAAFVRKYAQSLDISGMAVFGIGSVEPTRLLGPEQDSAPDAQRTVYRSLRIIIGRKDPARLQAGLKKAGTGTSLFFWEKT
jgi:hypothetical protein